MCFSAAASFASGGVLLFLGVCSLLLLLVVIPPPAAAGGGCCCSSSSTSAATTTTTTGMTAKQRAALVTVAAIPLIFGMHQITEGVVWTDMDNEHAVRCFAYTAYTFWPLYISLALALVEWTRRQPEVVGDSESSDSSHWSHWPRQIDARMRQRTIAFHVVLAAVLLAVVLAEMVETDPETVKENNNGRLQYEGWGLENRALTILMSIVYVYTVVGSLVISSLRYSTLFGGLVLVSMIVSVILWENQFPSTWCFFAAILSSMVMLIVWHELQIYKQEENHVHQDKKSTHSVEEAV